MQLLLAMYVDREDFKSAIPLAERMTAAEPKDRNNWINLSSYYQAVEQYDKALAALQIAYNAGLFTQSSDYDRLAKMASFNGVPYRCGQIMQKAIDDKTLKPDSDDYYTLSNCWISAREFDKSVPPLERAADLSDKGDLYVRLGQVHMQDEDWAAAADAIRKGLDKGKLTDEPNAQLFMGIALYSQNKLRDAVPYFQRAAKTRKYRDNANSFLQAINQKLSSK
jgi:tetratricopeptide (TPR) repeat protein